MASSNVEFLQQLDGPAGSSTPGRAALISFVELTETPDNCALFQLHMCQFHL
jgi:hypothetical protein